MNKTNNSRIYVSGLKPIVTADELKAEFAKYGNVSSIEIIVPRQHDTKSRKKSKEPFAYVTFTLESAADDLIAKHEEWKKRSGSQEARPSAPSILYSDVKLANPITTPCYPKRMKKSVDDYEQITNLVSQTDPRPNLVLVVHSSHLDRTMRLIFDLEKEKNEFPFDCPLYLGNWSSKTKNTAFIFLSTCNTSMSDDDSNASRMYWYDYFMSNPILVRFVIRKFYAVDQVIRIPPSEQDGEQRAKRLVDAALSLIGKTKEDGHGTNLVLKVKAYPPKQNDLQKQIVSTLYQRKEEIEKDDEWQRKFTMSSTDNTHIFSFLQLFNPQSYAKNMRRTDKQTLDEIFMIGVSPIPRHEIDNVPCYEKIDSNISDNEDICRAYFKLKEAMDYYRRDVKDAPVSFGGKVAFDCGSSPGGWTKYLLQDENCDMVYSCDPGKLDHSVLSMQGTRYLKMRGQDGIEKVRQEGKIVHLWVSDMCLADPKQQVKHLLMAKEKGILAHDANFVLTLKFNTGHSKETFERHAQEELRYLMESMKLANVKSYHLFSNRTGERTLVGKLQM